MLTFLLAFSIAVFEAINMSMHKKSTIQVDDNRACFETDAMIAKVGIQHLHDLSLILEALP